MTTVQDEAPSNVAEFGPYPQFILFGDSITQWSCKQDLGFNFMPALQDAFIRRLDVINRGFSGYNTAQARLILPKFLPKPDREQVDFFVVFFGANDACLENSASNQHVPLASYAQNLKDILTHSTVTVHKPHLILITPPPVNEYQLEAADLAKGQVEARRTAETTRMYAQACRQVGAELSVAVLDLWSAMMAKTGWKEGDELVGSKDVPRNEVLESMLADGLHFLPPAYQILFECMMALIVEKWPDQDPTEMAYQLPAWQEAPK